MVLPVWAHERNHPYPYIVMGGAQGVDPDDDSIGYHESYSSTENFYCPPSNLPLDAVSCASQFTGSKGVYQPGRISFYPPRADLDDLRQLRLRRRAQLRRAERPVGHLERHAARRRAARSRRALGRARRRCPNGQYVIKVEASLEGDFNAAHTSPVVPRQEPGAARLRQATPWGSRRWSTRCPSPSTARRRPRISDGAVGYGDWDGATGTLHALDGTINDTPGSGVGRLAHVTDADGTWRVKAFANGCQGCRVRAAGTDARGARRRTRR